VIFFVLVLSSQWVLADQSALSKQIDDLVKALTSEAAKDDAAQASIKALIGKIIGVDCAVETVKKADCKLAQLESFGISTKGYLDQAKISFLTEKQQTELWAAMTPLLSIPVEKRDAHIALALDFAAKQLDAESKGVFEPDVVTAGIAAVISKADPAIIAAKPANNLPLVKLDAMAVVLETAILQLDEVLATLPAKKRLNIISAWYGNIPVIKQTKGAVNPWAYNDRFCSATRAIRTRCQGKGACYQSAAATATGTATANSAAISASTAELTGALLCGYEPAPFSDPKDKGVVVYYECLAIPEGKWRTIGTGDPVRMSYGAPLSAELRASAIEEIRCQGNYE
jgi:hypothetical protein